MSIGVVNIRDKIHYSPKLYATDMNSSLRQIQIDRRSFV